MVPSGASHTRRISYSITVELGDPRREDEPPREPKPLVEETPCLDLADPEIKSELDALECAEDSRVGVVLSSGPWEGTHGLV